MTKEMRELFSVYLNNGAPIRASDQIELCRLWFCWGWNSSAEYRARAAGSAKSKRKAASSRKNGKLGGRPKRVNA